jgi:hypothetical protein
MRIFLKKILEADEPKGTSPSDAPPAIQPAAKPQSPSPKQQVPASDSVPTAPQSKDQQGNSYNLKFDLEDFQNKLAQATETIKNEFRDKILSQISNQKIQFRASKGYGQPEKEYIVNVDGVSIDFYYENYVVVIKGREPNKQKESEYFIKPPYIIKKLGAASVPSKKKTTAPVAPVPSPTQNVATKGI